MFQIISDFIMIPNHLHYKKKCAECDKVLSKVKKRAGFYQCKNKNCSSKAWLSYKEIYLSELKRRVEVLT